MKNVLLKKELKSWDLSWIRSFNSTTYTKGTPENQKFIGGSFLGHAVEGGVIEASWKSCKKWNLQIKELNGSKNMHRWRNKREMYERRNKRKILKFDWVMAVQAVRIRS